MRGGKNIPLRKRPRRLPEADGAGACSQAAYPFVKKYLLF